MEPDFPIEFLVEGTPVSLQTKRPEEPNGKRGKDASRAVLPDIGLRGDAWLNLIYFPDTSMQGDIDNIVKPILDALGKHIYVDDSQVERVVVQSLNAAMFSFYGPYNNPLESTKSPKAPTCDYPIRSRNYRNIVDEARQVLEQLVPQLQAEATTHLANAAAIRRTADAPASRARKTGRGGGGRTDPEPRAPAGNASSPLRHSSGSCGQLDWLATFGRWAQNYPPRVIRADGRRGRAPPPPRPPRTARHHKWRCRPWQIASRPPIDRHHAAAGDLVVGRGQEQDRRRDLLDLGPGRIVGLAAWRRGWPACP